MEHQKRPANPALVFFFHLLDHLRPKTEVVPEFGSSFFLPFSFSLVEEAGFEPAKAMPADLQSSPFVHLGTLPNEALRLLLRSPLIEETQGEAGASPGLAADGYNLPSFLRNNGNDISVGQFLFVPAIVMENIHIDVLPMSGAERHLRHQDGNGRGKDNHALLVNKLFS